MQARKKLALFLVLCPLFSLGTFLSASIVSLPAMAQEKPQGLPGNYPTKPIRILIGSSPGGGTDISTRLVMNKVAERSGHTFVMENIPGANGVLAINLVAKAPADGYTLLATSNSSLITAAFGVKVPFDVKSAFDPIAQFSVQPYILAVSKTLPVSSVKELIAYGKSHPGQLNYASSGIGGTSHIGMEQFNQMAGIKSQHVPYKGIGPGLVELMAGRIDLLFGSPLSVLPHLRDGQIKAIGISTLNRSPLMPDLTPVAADVPGFEMSGWYGLLAPAGTPEAIINALNREIVQAISSPPLAQRLAADGSEGPQGSPAEFKSVEIRELDAAARLIQQTGLKIEQ